VLVADAREKFPIKEDGGFKERKTSEIGGGDVREQRVGERRCARKEEIRGSKAKKDDVRGRASSRRRAPREGHP
jgi:hypothetical protein